MTREEAIEVLKERYLTCVGIGLDNHANRVNEAIDMAIEALSAPSGDLISRDDAIDAVRKSEHRITIADEQGGVGTVKWDMWGVYTAEAVEAIKALPSAETVHKPDYSYEADMVKRLRQAEAVQGEWTKVIDEKTPNVTTWHYECSQCGAGRWEKGQPYCSNCGAIMLGGDTE